VGAWTPEFWLSLTVAVLFASFGVQSLLFDEDEKTSDAKTRSSHSLFVTALLLIFIAKFGDKTQLAVAGLASTYHGLPVRMGSTLALLGTTALGVSVGQRLLKRMPLRLINKFSGVLLKMAHGLVVARSAPLPAINRITCYCTHEWKCQHARQPGDQARLAVLVNADGHSFVALSRLIGIGSKESIP
jgi:Uncharacterized protein family UPF0016